MTVTGSSRGLVRAGSVATVAVMLAIGTAQTFADEPALTMRATVVGAAGAPPLTIELLRWSTDTERTPLLAALSPPPAPPAEPAGTGAASAGGRAAGRGGRGGGRGGPGAAPATPAVRLSGAIAAAPTVGFIWGAGPTGYSIKYAWRSSSPEGQERIVLATDRRLGAHAPSWPAATGAAADADYTVLEIRIDGKGAGQAKASLAAAVVVDAAAKTLALDGYATAPVLLEVTR
jgi:hypothetical protein